MMMRIDEMNYNQWQRRNSDIFNNLSKKQKQAARERGYFNVGWDKVKHSWEIVKPITLFNRKLKKGDIHGALNQSILEAEEAQKIAKKAIQDLNDNYNNLSKATEVVLGKYQLL